MSNNLNEETTPPSTSTKVRTEDDMYSTLEFLEVDRTEDFSSTKPSTNSRYVDVPNAIVLGELDADVETVNRLRESPDIREQLDSIFLQNIEQSKQDIRQAFEDSEFVDPDDFKETVLAATEIDQQIQDNAEKPGGLEEQVALSIAPLNYEEEKVKLVKLKNMMARDLLRIWDEADIVDVIQDFGGLLVPFGFTKDQYDLHRSNKLRELFDNPEENLKGLLRAWHATDADRKLEYWPILRDEILKATKTSVLGLESDANVVKTAVLISAFMDPNEGIEDAEFEKNLDLIVGPFGTFEAVQAIRWLGRLTRTAAQRSHTARQAAEVGNQPLSDELSTLNIMEEDIARASGLSRQESVNIGDPSGASTATFSPESIPGASPGVINNLNKMARIKVNTLHSFSDDSDRLRYGLTSLPEREFAIQSKIDKLTDQIKEDYLLDDGVYLGDISLDLKNPSSATVRYKVYDADGIEIEDMGPGQATIDWTLDDVTGNWTETVQGINDNVLIKKANNLLISPSTIASKAERGKTIETDFIDTFRNASGLDDTTELDKKLISNSLKVSLEPYKRLNKAGRQNVDDVLLAGDEYVNPHTGVRGREWTIQELRSGIIIRPGGGSVRLTTDDEISAYLMNRMHSDMMFKLQNQATRKQYQAMGIKSVRGLEDLESMAKVYDTTKAAKNSDVVKNGVTIFDRQSGRLVSYSSDELDQAYEEGYKLVRLTRPNKVPEGLSTVDDGNQFFNFALVHTDDIQELPMIVNHRRPGHVPKKNKGVEWLVKENTSLGTLNNGPFPNSKTLRFLSNEKDAEKVAKELLDRDLNNIARNPDLTDAQRAKATREAENRYKVVEDRELTPEQKLAEGQGWSGGPFNRARATEDILYGLNGIKTERFSPMEIYQREINMITPYLSRNEWRLGEQQRFLNTVKERMGDLVEIKGFNNTVLPKDHPDSAALELLRDQLRIWTNIPTQQETLWSSSMQSLHDWTLKGARGLGFNSKESIKSVLWFKHKDPFSAMKSASFHTTLGLLNPVQLWVQAQAATVAAARYPTHAPKASAYAVKMAYLDRIDDANTNGRVAGLLNAGGDVPLITEIHRAWQRTGLFHSVRTNADISSMELGVGNSLNAMKRVLDSGLAVYRAGELFNRRFSFTSSYLDWKKKNPTAKLTDEALKDIVADAKLSMLELNRANAARFQGGPNASDMENVLGVMFQFGQVATKTLELAAKGQKRGGFSGAEKTRIFAAQLGLYGTVGVPLVNQALDYYLEATGTPAETLDPKFVSQWQGGMMEVLFRHGFGADVDIGTRASVAGNIGSFLVDLVDGSEGISWETAGALGSLGTRVGDLLSLGIYPVLDTALAKDENLSMEDLQTVGKQLLNVPTSTRNAVAGWLMHTRHQIVNNKGQIIAAPDAGFNLATELMTAWGFSPSQKTRVYELQADAFDVETQIKDASDVIFSLIYNSAVINGGDFPSKEGLRKADRLLHDSIDKSLHPRIIKNIQERLMNPTTVEERALKKWYKNTIIDPVSGVLTSPVDRSFGRDFTTKKPLQQPFGQQKDLSKDE